MALHISGDFTISVIQKKVDTSKSLQIPTHYVQKGTVTYRKEAFIITPLISPKPPDGLWCPSNFLFIGKREFLSRESKGGGGNLISHFHVVLRFRMNAGIHLLPQHTVMEYTGTKCFSRVWLFTKFFNISTNITERKNTCLSIRNKTYGAKLYIAFSKEYINLYVITNIYASDCVYS